MARSEAMKARESHGSNSVDHNESNLEIVSSDDNSSEPSLDSEMDETFSIEELIDIYRKEQKLGNRVQKGKNARSDPSKGEFDKVDGSSAVSEGLTEDGAPCVVDNTAMQVPFTEKSQPVPSFWLIASQEQEAGQADRLQVCVQVNPGNPPPKWMTDFSCPQITNISSITVPKQKKAGKKVDFRTLLATVGIDPALVSAKSVEDVIPLNADLVITNGDFNHNGNTPVVRNHTFAIFYRISCEQDMAAELCQVIVDENNYGMALRKLTLQRFGFNVPDHAAEVIALRDLEGAKKVVRSFDISFESLSEDKLHIGFGGGKIPIVQHPDLTPEFNESALRFCPEFLYALWAVYGLDAFETDSFREALDEQQHQFRQAYNQDRPEEAARYIAENSVVLKYGPSDRLLAIDGVPETQLTEGMHDIKLLMEKFGDGLRELLLSSDTPLSGVLVNSKLSEPEAVVEELAIKWLTSEWIMYFVKIVKKQYFLHINLLNPHSHFTKFLDSFFDAGRMANGKKFGNQFTKSNSKLRFDQRDRIAGTLAKGGLAYSSNKSLLLIPSPSGMSTVYLVQKDPLKSVLTPIYLELYFEKQWFVQRWLRIILKKPPVVRYNKIASLPYIVAGTTGDGVQSQRKLFVFEVIRNDVGKDQMCFEEVHF